MSTEVTSANFPGELTVPKSSITTEANNSDVENNGEAAAEPVVALKKTPVKRKATPKKAAANKEENGDQPEEPTTPKPAKKRTPRAKKEVKSEAKAETEGDSAAGEGGAETPATPTAASSTKKRGAKAVKGETETPTKKRKTKAAANGDSGTPAKTPKAKGNKFPESWEEFSEGDKLLVRMRKESKNWEEIEKAWTAVTGQVPGKDVLRKKETKLRALAVEWKAGDARKLAEFKAQVEEESAAVFKKLEAEKWIKVVDMFKIAGSEYTSPGLQKKWELMQKKGEVDTKGNYIGNDAEVPQAAAEGSQASADIQVNEDGDAENEDGSNGDAEAENEEA